MTARMNRSSGFVG